MASGVIPEITSRRHPAVSEARELVRDASARRKRRLCVVEGPRVVADALQAGAPVTLALTSPRLEELEGGVELLATMQERASAGGGRMYLTTDEVLESVSDTRAPQGVVLVTPRPIAGELPRASARPLLVAWELQDPGNVGTIVRTAEAAGCAAVVLAHDTGGASADPHSPRAVRAAAGSSFRAAVHEWTLPSAEMPRRLLGLGYGPVACEARGGSPPEVLDLAGAAAFVIGSETRGLPADLVASCELRLSLPLAGRVESLSAPAAAAAILFEAARQRHALAGPLGLEPRTP